MPALSVRCATVGGCAVGLLTTYTAAAPVRVTFDVDLVARVSALAAYHGIEKEFVRLGFSRALLVRLKIALFRLFRLIRGCLVSRKLLALGIDLVTRRIGFGAQ